MAFTRLSSQDCVDWLRQKTRTSAVDTGEWTNAFLMPQINAAVREMATRIMAASPFGGHFLVKKSMTLAAEVTEVQTAGYGIVRFAFMRYASTHSDTARRLKLVRGVSIERLVHDANFRNPDSDGVKVADDRYYVIRTKDHELSPASVGTVLVIELYNWTFATTEAVEIWYYALPEQFGLVPSATDFVGLPPFAWNAMLSYALILMLEDDRNMQARTWAAARFALEERAMVAAALLNADMPFSPTGAIPGYQPSGAIPGGGGAA